MRLLAKALIKFILGFILVTLMLFIPAGTINWLNGQIFMSILFAPMFVFGIVLFIKNPQLLEKRLNAKERENTQKTVLLLSGLMFIAGFVIAGLSYRYNFLQIPKIIVIIALVIFLFAYIMLGVVVYENTYLSRTIEVVKNQKVIDTGLYGIVRHPMYTATIFLFLTFPLILGSLLSFFVFLVYPFIIVIRIKNEEQVLERELDGYTEYKKKVKYKLLPFIW